MHVNLVEIYDKILKTGLTRYKSKNSKASLPARVAAEKEDKLNKKGAVFAVKTKEHFLEKGVLGYIVTSKETLLEDASGLTHWTPNVYRVFTYADEKRTLLKGYSEENLLQINTFVIDIDTKRYSREEILMTCMDNSIGLPTLLLETTKGYQAYFVLETPIYISNKNDFRSLKVAKTIAKNLKHSLGAVEADLCCNDFGFFRLPKSDNVVFYQADLTYDVKTIINWSMQQSDDKGENPFFVVPSKPGKKASVMESDWFQALISAKHIKGQKGQLGRNNTLFTLALVCYQEGWEEARALDLLDQFNSNLQVPLRHNEVQILLSSAYSGKYNGASEEYVQALLDEYVPNQEFVVKLGGSGWYKFKKEREERERSHYDEWEQDLIAYLTAEFDVSEPFLLRTQKQICDAIKIPQSTLNELIKQSNKIIRTVTGTGRNKKTGWTTVALFKQHILYAMQQSKAEFRNYLQTLLLVTLPTCTASPAVAHVKTVIEQFLGQKRAVLDVSVENTS